MIDSELTGRISVHALHLGDRINTSGYEGDIISANPLAVRAGARGAAILFRYGVAVLVGLTAAEEAAFLDSVAGRILGRIGQAEEESTTVEIAGGADDQIAAGGPIKLGDMSSPRILIVADVLAKSVALASDEREVTKVFGIIEPFAAELATRGRTRRNRTEILKLIGNALLVQHRVSGRVAVAEKPDALWDRPDLERLYARLEDEYELKERVETLDRKVAVIAETAETLADIIDTRRSLRLELIVVILIAIEIATSFYQIFLGKGAH
ncbi:RMD1 family protein [Rhodopseudomonas sp. P2A-2r]|uniref:RMD1 family protein n=1 Tax=unclassified Rhodopseudomonas TaxID=2638247 RepID=UPI0022347B17|nr:RMD1 family protein [Rhodopseudomonas sp. P2A-2r]UZE48961.1 RMD1 family protein [Rhodopseudomonas sp. P2A-2r]